MIRERKSDLGKPLVESHSRVIRVLRQIKISSSAQLLLDDESLKERFKK